MGLNDGKLKAKEAAAQPAPSTLFPGSTAATRGNNTPLAPNKRRFRVSVTLLGPSIVRT
jgi:hypothetical protein